MKGLVEMFFNLFGKRNLLTAKSGDPDFEKEKVSFLQSIKLVHCSNLQTWHKFPRYQQCDAITYYDYFIGQQQLKKLESAYSHVIGAYNKLAQLDTGEVKVYKTFTVEVAPSLFHTIRGISLAMPAFEETVVTVNEGEWQAGKLIVKAKWSKKSVQVTYACPSHIQNAEEIAVTRKKISELTADEQAAFHEIKKSRFSQPVLFISHRWETKNHPDPDCNQLEKLRLLEDCFIIYDYCSFPQEPLNIDEASKLQCILKYMGKLIENVVILHSADYTNRGWCIYEYIASSFLSSVVCDEIQEPAFVALRDWVSTRVPFPTNLFRDSWESQQQNYINDSILSNVNKILPLFKNSAFSKEEDRKLVRMLLLELLNAKLPARKEHQQYLGEWKTSRWTRDELSGAFENELTWDREISLSRPSFDMHVPATIAEAVQLRYSIKRDTTFKTTLF